MFGGEHAHGVRGHGTEIKYADGTAECAEYGKKLSLGERLGMIDADVAWDRFACKRGGPAEVACGTIFWRCRTQ
jgi:hypothetical protein